MNNQPDTAAVVAIEALEEVAETFRQAAATYLAADDALRAAICHSAQYRLRREAKELAAHLF